AGYVYGPHAAEAVAVRDRLIAGDSVAAGDPGVLANWIHQDDLARAILLALQTKPAGKILNIVDNQPASAVDFIGYLAESMHLPAPSGGQSLLARILPAREPHGGGSLPVRARRERAGGVLRWTPPRPASREGRDTTLLVRRAAAPGI